MKNIFMILPLLLVLISAYCVDPPETRTYFVTNGTRNSCDIFEYNVTDIDTLNMLLVGSVGSTPQIDADDEVLFKCGERYYGQVDLSDGAIYDGLTFSDYGTGDKPIIDGSIEHFWFNKNNSNTYDSTYTNEGKTFYTKSLSGLDSIINLYANNIEQILAREPNVDEGEGGFNLIDSIAGTTTFIDNSNSTTWTGGDAVIRTINWMCELREIDSATGSSFSLNYATTYPLQANWGYFVQNDIDALDDEKEWYFDEATDILYFCPDQDSCEVYAVTNQGDWGYGFLINDKEGITIENLELINQSVNIQFEDGTGSDVSSDDITIYNNDLSNSNTGISFRNLDSLTNSTISYNSFKRMRSNGISGRGEGNTVEYNTIDSIGLNFGCENFKQHNLNAIEVFGSNSDFSNNTISNIGFCGIRHSGENCKINYNTITDTMLKLSDGGGIYCWHNISGNKEIKGNTISGSLGNGDGSVSKSLHGNGIYLDELSCHFNVEDNDITECANGIYVQNSRSDTIVNNDCYGNHYNQLSINHGGSILNGGSANPDNDNEYDPTVDGYGSYTWDSVERTLYDSVTNHYVYVEPGNNYIHNNNFTPNDSTYTIRMRLWKKIDENTIEDMTSNTNFIADNLASGYSIEDGSLLMSYSNVNDSTVVYYVGQAYSSSSLFLDSLKSARKLRIEGITGSKTY